MKTCKKVCVGCVLICCLVSGLIFTNEVEGIQNSSYDTEAIIGTDDRVMVSDTTAPVYRTIVKIIGRGQKENGKRFLIKGTGVMIDHNTVLTAAHVVYDSAKKEYYQNIRIIPASYKDGHITREPYGVTTASDVQALPGYLAGDGSKDIAVIKLKDALGEKTGYLPISTYINVKESVKIIGYPGDKEGMYWSEGSVIDKRLSTLYYDVDTFGGQSGAPVLNEFDEVVAIHSSGIRPVKNMGILISSEVTQLLDKMKESSSDVYRLYHPSDGHHLYTVNKFEKDYLVSIGWLFKGVAWKANMSGTPVFRLYHSHKEDHVFTTDDKQRDAYIKQGWKSEGISFYSGNGADVYQLFNSQEQKHFYTVNADEKDSLVSIGWDFEGIAFKAHE